MDSPLLNLHDYEERARTVLPKMVFDFIAGGSGDEVTLAANRAAFSEWNLLPRVMRGLEAASTSTTVLGQEIALPVIVAPTSLHRMITPEGEVSTARAVKRAGSIYAVSTAASIPLEMIGAEAGPWWFQIYIFKDRGLTRDLVERAVANGAQAVVLTVDLARFGRREASTRNNFQLPAGIGPVNLAPAQTGDHALDSNPSNLLPTFGGEFEPALTWADLEWMVEVANVPVLVKGILHPEDGVMAVEHGASGVIVSNHGGRQLDGAVASVAALPEVVAAIDGRAEVLVDGGIRRSSDILKALALGARAVLIGRPVLWGLAVDGENGAFAIFDLLLKELEVDMMLAGLGGVAEIDGNLLVSSR